jgi:ADP-heptose:LPS heptosyltransferase
MGDCLLLTGPVRALKQEFPDFRIAVLVEARFAPCFDGNPDFDEVLIAGGKFVTGLKLLTRRFHAVVNLHGGPTSLLYSFLTWGKRIGSEHYRAAKLYHGRVPAPVNSAHTVESTMACFQWLGLRCQRAPALRYEPHSAEAVRIQEKLKGRPYVVVHPGSIMETKRWEARRFGEVARGLAQSGFTIVVTAGPGEESLTSLVAHDIEGTVILLSLTFPELAERCILRRLSVRQPSRSGVLPTPVVGAHGASNIGLFRILLSAIRVQAIVAWSPPRRSASNP